MVKLAAPTMQFIIGLTSRLLLLSNIFFLSQGTRSEENLSPHGNDFRAYILCPKQQIKLRCAIDEKIRIHSANYGRQHRFICGKGYTMSCSTRQSTTAKMREMCDGRRECRASTDHGDFHDACPGENKYLHVVHTCEKRKIMPVQSAPQAYVPHCGISGSAHYKKRIVHGTAAVPGRWPWQVVLLKGARKKFSCGGTLIHPSWVLTAAHCISSRKKNYYTVRLGEFDRAARETNEQKIRVKRAIRHPNYFKHYPLNNDIALLELETPATFSERVGVACLPESDYEVPVNDPETKCFLTGWGKTIYKGKMPLRLREVEVPPVSRAKCAVRLAKSPGGRHRTITNHMICGGDDNTGVSGCQGDSGGPYVCRNKEGYWELQGVVSWGSPKCSLKQRFTVFAQVSKVRGWIDEYIRDLGSNTR